MAQAEKTAAQASSTQNGGANVVSIGPRDVLQGRLEIQGDLKVAGNVEGDLKASGDVTIDSTAASMPAWTIRHSSRTSSTCSRLMSARRARQNDEVRFNPGSGPRAPWPVMAGMSGRGESSVPTLGAASGAAAAGPPTAGLKDDARTLHATTTNKPTTTNSATTIHVSGVRISLRMTPG